MRLTQHTDYALRMLIYLAIHRDGIVRVSDVAESYALSRNHLLKVANRLARLGIVTATRGRSGGIALALDPSKINIGTVVRNLEDDFALVDCLSLDGGHCVIAPACRLKGLVSKAIDAFLSVLDGYTLADIASNRDALAALLNAPTEPSEAA